MVRNRSGAFPVRAPVGLLLGTLVATLLLPCWLWLGFKTAPELQQFYLGSYFKSGLQAALPNVGRKPVEKQYLAVLDGPNLAVQTVLDRHPETMRREVIAVNPGAFHA